MKTIIYHVPFKLNYQSTSASGIRPLRMLAAFQSLGFDVFVIDGQSAERKQKIKLIKTEIEQGKKIAFVYSESSTMPTALTDSHHLPIRPFLDFNFFRFCKFHNIPIGLFYRDIYWKFSQYGVDLPLWKKVVSKFFYRYDVRKYQKLIDVLYLPSLDMAQFLPEITREKIKALPPGFMPKNRNFCNKVEKLNILYVGGISEHYRMHVLFKVVSQFPEVSLTICTREAEWKNKSEEYDLGVNNNITVVHKSGDELQKLFAQTDIFSLFVEPLEYRDFAVPFKLFEYLGERKPIIASCGTLAGKFVEKNKIGWTIPYEEKELYEFLNSMLANKKMIYSRDEAITQIYDSHTWEARVKQVIQDIVKRS